MGLELESLDTADGRCEADVDVRSTHDAVLELVGNPREAYALAIEGAVLLRCIAVRDAKW